MWERISAFGISHSVDFAKGDSVLHVPISILHQAVPKSRNSARLLKLSSKIDQRVAQKKKV